MEGRYPCAILFSISLSVIVFNAAATAEIDNKVVSTGKSVQFTCSSSFSPIWEFYGVGSLVASNMATGASPLPTFKNSRYGIYRVHE